MSKHIISHKNCLSTVYPIKYTNVFPSFPWAVKTLHFAAREKLSQPLDSKVNLQPLEEGSGR